MLRRLFSKRWVGVLALTLAFAVAVPVVAHAANTGPYNLDLSIGANQPAYSTEHTGFSNKTNNTPVYAKATQTSGGLVVGVSGIDGYSLAVTNRTNNTYAYFRALNQASSIYNTVYQHEYLAWFWICKKASAPNSQLYVCGEWAPDSITTYYVINAGYNE